MLLMSFRKMNSLTDIDFLCLCASIYIYRILCRECIALNITLIPIYGITGTIVASLLSYIVLIAYRWTETSQRYFKVNVSMTSVLVLAVVIAGQFVFVYSRQWWIDALFMCVATVIMVLYSPKPVREKLSALVAKYRGR